MSEWGWHSFGDTENAKICYSSLLYGVGPRRWGAHPFRQKHPLVGCLLWEKALQPFHLTIALYRVMFADRDRGNGREEQQWPSLKYLQRGPCSRKICLCHSPLSSSVGDDSKVNSLQAIFINGWTGNVGGA